MKIWYHHVLDSQRFIADVLDGPVRIGRHGSNDIVLDSPFVADEAAVLNRRGDFWEVVALGTNGCVVDATRLRLGERHRLREDSQITVFPFKLTLETSDEVELSDADIRRQRDDQTSALIRQIHLHLLSVMDCSVDEDCRGDRDEYLMTLERNIEEIARLEGLTDPERAELRSHIAGCCVRSELIEQLIESAGRRKAVAVEPRAAWARIVTVVPDREQELAATIEKAISRLGLRSTPDLSRQMDVLDDRFWAVWDEMEADLFEEFRLYLALRQLKKQIKDILFGYGPLEDLLRAPSVTEIMVVSRDRIYIEKNGVVENSGRQFISDEVTETVIERIVSKVGRRIDKSQPLVDARLIDGSRVNAVIGPLAVSGPCLTIRKFPLERLTIDDLIQFGSITPTVADFLRSAVIARRNILISGGTGSGKTTLLNCLAEFIPEKERIVTIEDTAELRIHKEHVVRLETKKANIEGAGAYTIHDLVKNALRMRPDRIVVGECRGAEALDMLQAMNTGHDGSLTTVHANSAADVILRLEVMVQSAADLPVDSIHRQIASAVDLVVHVARMRDGSRRVAQVTEFVGIDEETGGIRTKDLFLLEGVDGAAELCPTGRLPTFMGQLIERNLISLDTFYR